MSGDTEALLDSYTKMLTIRRFEEQVSVLHQGGMIVGSVHLCNGQEAIPVGTCGALELDRDCVFPTYRGHGWSLACGVPTRLLFAELLGRETGINGGRGGSAYHSAPEYGMYGENSIVGAGTPIACGAALATQFDGSGRVALAVFGDGATNQGAVHEAMNFAAVRQLPVVFLIENNHYSELTPISAMSRVECLFTRASAYGMKGLRIDGNDVETVAETMRQVVSTVREGGGPLVVEATTDRIVGHYIGDAQLYRPRGEGEAAVQREPLVRTRQVLVDRGAAEEELTAIEEAVAVDISSACDWALSSDTADPANAEAHLYG